MGIQKCCYKTCSTVQLSHYLQANDVYKAFVAAAPVVDWALYDTAYTERYLGLPKEQETAYKMGSILTYAKNLPSDRCRLLIIHGGKDENVHFLHTSNLLTQLNKMGKPYSFGVGSILVINLFSFV
ncbi:dipeptidylpeptidase [Cichlidogyrus casuarinus]|uniref:Dipeptidylpeptidase n=1 Tax=Cichlidogyrus casuarinus TaxID=1844966 RepID=A0ABD2PVI3_9PLAT